MSIAINSAISAYSNAARGAGMEAPKAPGSSFAELVKGAAEDALAAGHKAEAATLQAVDGSAEVSEVVTAIADAELALQTVVAVRDQVISAYQEILRMPI